MHARPWEYQPPIPPFPATANNLNINTPTTGTLTLTAAQLAQQVIPFAMTLTGNLVVSITRPGTWDFDLDGARARGIHDRFQVRRGDVGADRRDLGGTGQLARVIAGARGQNTLAVSFPGGESVAVSKPGINRSRARRRSSMKRRPRLCRWRWGRPTRGWSPGRSTAPSRRRRGSGSRSRRPRARRCRSTRQRLPSAPASPHPTPSRRT